MIGKWYEIYKAKSYSMHVKFRVCYYKKKTQFYKKLQNRSMGDVCPLEFGFG
jgi:hypothetical protein